MGRDALRYRMMKLRSRVAGGHAVGADGSERNIGGGLTRTGRVLEREVVGKSVWLVLLVGREASVAGEWRKGIIGGVALM
jgi:hypothetical protein